MCPHFNSACVLLPVLLVLLQHAVIPAVLLQYIVFSKSLL